jgi:hypothetical protein
VTSGATFAALTHVPAFAAFLVNFLIGLVACLLGWRYRHAPDVRLLRATGGDAAAQVRPRPRWLGTCGRLHLLNALIFALVMAPSLVATSTVAHQPAANAIDATTLLLPVCVLVSLSALMLANLTERVTANDRRPSRMPLLPATIMIGIVEAILFALDRADIGTLVSQGAWLLACILMTGGLVRLGRRDGDDGPNAAITLLTALGFFLRALLTLLGVLQIVSTLLPAGNTLTFAALGGTLGGAIDAAPLLKVILALWTGIGLLLMALSWGGRVRQQEVERPRVEPTVAVESSRAAD